MKKFAQIIVVSLLVMLVMTIVISANNVNLEQSDPTIGTDVEFQSDNDFLVKSFEGYVLIAPYNGDAYVIRGPELEVFISNTITFGNTACNEAFPLSYEDYYRVVSANSDMHIIHGNDLETLCN